MCGVKNLPEGTNQWEAIRFHCLTTEHLLQNCAVHSSLFTNYCKFIQPYPEWRFAYEWRCMADDQGQDWVEGASDSTSCYHGNMLHDYLFCYRSFFYSHMNLQTRPPMKQHQNNNNGYQQILYHTLLPGNHLFSVTTASQLTASSKVLTIFKICSPPPAWAVVTKWAPEATDGDVWFGWVQRLCENNSKVRKKKQCKLSHSTGTVT